MKKKITLRLLLLVVAVFLVNSCRNDYLQEQTPNSNLNASKFRILKLKDVPKIETFIHKESGREDLMLPLSEKNSVSGKTTTSFGETDPSLIVEKTDGNETYYVMKVINTSGSDAIYNLEVKETDGIIVKAEVIEYNPTDGVPLDFSGFSGTVSSYSLKGDPIHSSDYEDGEGGCPPGGGPTPGYNGSDDPNPGGNGPYYGGGGGGQGTDPIHDTSGCWEVLLNPEKPWLTWGWENKCTGEVIQAPKNKTGDNLSADCGDGSGVVITNPTDPCAKAKPFITSANTVLHNNEVKTKMDAILRGKTKALNEWSVALGKKPNGIEVTNPVEGIPGQNGVGTPVSQLQNPFIGDGHSHKGARGNPSGGDLYEMIKGLLTQPEFKYRFVYGNNTNDTPEVYVLVVDNPTLATNFLSQYPESENCNNTNEDHTIKEGSPLGKEFYKARKHYSEGRSEDTSGEDYESRSVAMAYILEKFNTGMSIAHVDADGNLRKINAKVEQITVPSSGAVKEGVKVSKCP